MNQNRRKQINKKKEAKEKARETYTDAEIHRLTQIEIP